jgi:uncharacterized membrane protein HdeD (DUF308 family)
MLVVLANNWWTILLRGIVAILFGVLIILWPEISISILVFLFGIFAIADGLFSIISELRRYGEHARWWVLVFEGLAGVGIGVVAILWPEITAIIVLYLVASWGLVTGFLEIIAAIRLRNELEGEWILILTGLLSIAIGILLFLFPNAGLIAMVWMIGIYAIFFGISLIALSFRLRAWKNTKQNAPGKFIHEV